MVNRPRVLLADDHVMVTEGLKSLLSDEFDLVGVVGDGRALIAAVKKLKPDVVVADISMPRLNGIDALVRLRSDHPEIKVIMLDDAPERRLCAARAPGRRIGLRGQAFGAVRAGDGNPRRPPRERRSSRRRWPARCSRSWSAGRARARTCRDR